MWWWFAAAIGCDLGGAAIGKGGSGLRAEIGKGLRAEIGAANWRATAYSKNGKNSDKANATRSKHSVTEQRRRSKINERFQILRELIPHSDQKRDTASFMNEVIQYVQYLQEKVQKYEGSYQPWSSEPTKLMPWGNGDKRSVKNLKKLFNSYEEASGQAINFEKSEMYLSKHFTDIRRNQTKEVLGCQATNLPFKYLGAPIFKGRSKEAYFEPAISKIISRIGGWKNKFLTFAGKITLINSVLSSMITYIMASTVVPLSVIKKVEKILRTFLWSQNNQDRTSWVSWKDTCKPVEEGGVGIRNLKDTLYGYQGKLAWNLIQGNSLWSKIMNQKYNIHGNMKKNQSASAMWKILYPHVDTLKKDSTWVIGKGNINFWTQKWADEILAPEDTSNTTMKMALEMKNYLYELLSPTQISILDNISLDDNMEDTLIYNPSSNGKFSLKVYVKNSNQSGQKKDWSEIAWNKIIPPKTKAFMWKAFQNALPVDKNLVRKGIMGPFKCVCCDKGNEETINHLLIQSDIARRTWDHFGKVLGTNNHYNSLEQHVRGWMNGRDIHTQGGALILSIITTTLKEIWNSRCQAKYDDGSMNDKEIIRKVMSQIHIININLKPTKNQTTWEKIIVEKLGIPVKHPKPRMGRWVHWHKPEINLYKLNVDGAFKNNMGAVGGILRDHYGNFRAAFWGQTNTDNIEQTELRAITIGVDMCKKIGYSEFEVETDSSKALDFINGVLHSQDMSYEARRCKSQGIKFSKILRQQNLVADALAKQSAGTDNWNCNDINQIHHSIRKLIYLDRLGLDYFRP
ncbi:hypothetical protein CASFOL_034944 [Castilleja foliolosa]|uniref:BHLH domain-containing protein n=2 Tax=Castilleja foliolosa TaxID=1961234 RepID=A0ABD3BRZ8_9LAMI